MTKVLLDINGVLDPFLASALPPPWTELRSDWTVWRINPREHGAWLRELETKAEIVWASSWEADSNSINAAFDLKPAYPHIDFSGPSGTGTWKLPAVQRFLRSSTEPVIWLDDEFEADAYSWAQQRGATLLIECDPAVGWTQSQWTQMLAFLVDHTKPLTFSKKLAKLKQHLLRGMK